MFFSRNEIIGGIIALIIIAAMGVITFTGPYHVVNTKAGHSSSANVHLIVRPPKGFTS